MSDELTFIIAIGGFMLAHREQSFYFELTQEQDEDNDGVPVTHRQMWFIWITMAGIFCIVSAYLLSKMLLTI
jgi:hypothetical protein